MQLESAKKEAEEASQRESERLRAALAAVEQRYVGDKSPPNIVS